METHHFGADWANDAFVTLNQNDLHADKWPSFGNPNFSSPTFTIPPSLLTQGSVERFGQVTPPEELSPTTPTTLSREARETSIPVEELRNEALFPDHQLQALQNFLPKSDQQSRPQNQPQIPSPPLSSSSKQQQDEGRASKRRRTSRNSSSASQASSAAADPSPAQSSDNPQPPKRKRGRPKSQPQMIEAFTADGFPFQVSSARQSHLEKNRVAAHKCRQRKKEYIGSLESRAREHANKNKALKENIAMLREELLELKNEVLRHAGCGFWAVDEYLTRCAGDLLGMRAPSVDNAISSRMQQTNFTTTSSRSPDMHSHSQSQSPALSTLEPGKMHRHSSISSSNDSLDDEFNGFDLLQDIDEENEIQVV
ncbi:hypothetical protein DM02DRAFT_516760 [Periconia macrospinosa]|uniref:BZIP domain-containing protein n=1 Tax=Periconia macrospinosa TaxID=97972 RepID=A0A2V1E8B0_9PLEO|nr:hypothetical protein DM02DRAFT_516760 [Periconia macrospinosa]